MKYSEFSARVNHNTDVLKNALSKNDNLITIADKLYTWDHSPGDLHFSILMRNLHDLIPCAFLGALANTKTNGVDGYTVTKDGRIEFLELKTSEIASSKVWKGPKGGLCVGTGRTQSRRQGLTSAMSASYKCFTHSNLQSKNLRTILLIADTDNMMGDNRYIDAWEMQGKTVMKYLLLSDKSKRDIKFGSFKAAGFPAKTVVPLPGFEKFKFELERVALDRDDWLEQVS